MTDSVRRFYALALAMSWAGWIPFAAAQAGLLPIRVPVEVPIVAQFGPSAAALLLTAKTAGLGGVRRLLEVSCRWRVGFHWYAIAILLPPAIAAVLLTVHGALGSNVPGWSAWRGLDASYVRAFGTAGPYALDKSVPASAGPIAFLQHLIAVSPYWAVINFLVFAILTGPVSEEFGWRGYALPRLQARLTPFRAAVIVGVLWGLWHTGPDFWRLLFGGDARAFLYPLVITLGTIPLSVLLAWMFNRTRGSLLSGMLLHASFNSTLYVLSLIWLRHSAVWTGVELGLGIWIAAVAVALKDPVMDRVPGLA